MIEELKNIEYYQKAYVFHPFTCGNDSKHKVLKPTIRKGKLTLECQDCNYVQENVPSVPSIQEIDKMRNDFNPEPFNMDNLKKGVQIIILNDLDEILIAKRAPFKKDMTPRIGACRWNLIGGKVEKNENFLTAAQREMKEETNIQLLKTDFTEIKTEINDWDLRFDPFLATLFICKISNFEIELNDEHTEYKFISINDIPKYNLLGFTKNTIKKEVKKYFIDKGR